MAAAAGGHPFHRRGAAHCCPHCEGRLASAPGPSRRNIVPGKSAISGSAARRRDRAGRRVTVNALERFTGPPADLEVWLLLGYGVVMLAGARVTEALARAHFRRARSFAESG